LRALKSFKCWSGYGAKIPKGTRFVGIDIDVVGMCAV
jgi:hypothetical protein